MPFCGSNNEPTNVLISNTTRLPSATGLTYYGNVMHQCKNTIANGILSKEFLDEILQHSMNVKFTEILIYFTGKPATCDVHAYVYKELWKLYLRKIPLNIYIYMH